MSDKAENYPAGQELSMETAPVFLCTLSFLGGETLALVTKRLYNSTTKNGYTTVTSPCAICTFYELYVFAHIARTHKSNAHLHIARTHKSNALLHIARTQTFAHTCILCAHSSPNLKHASQLIIFTASPIDRKAEAILHTQKTRK